MSPSTVSENHRIASHELELKTDHKLTDLPTTIKDTLFNLFDMTNKEQRQRGR